MVMDTAMGMVKMAMVNTERPANPELPNYNADCNALVITMDPLTESWDHRRDAQSGRTSKSTET
jgi:hypothetical protein